jgi:hypothetical protein
MPVISTIDHLVTKTTRKSVAMMFVLVAIDISRLSRKKTPKISANRRRRPPEEKSLFRRRPQPVSFNAFDW